MATFTKFSALPTELQLLVWKLAAPACIFKLGWDCNTAEPASRGTLRPLPPMAHVCRAAREIIGQGIAGANFPSSSGLFTFPDVARFRADERFHFATKLDTLWVPSDHAMTDTHIDFLYHGIFDGRFTLELGTHLLHLATERHYIYDVHRTFPERIYQFFPNLETLTILITNPTMFLTPNQQNADPALYPAFAAKLHPEVNGEINLNFAEGDLHFQFIVEFECASMREVFQAMKTKFPGRKVPTLKFRDKTQFSTSLELVNDDAVGA